MKKFFKSWVFVLCAAVFSLLLIFFISQYIWEASSPSKGWSRAIKIGKVDNSQVADTNMIRVTTLPMIKDNSFVTFWETNNTLNYQITSNEGKIIENGKFHNELPEFYDINSSMHNEKIEFYGTSSKGLYKYEVDLNNHQMSNGDLIDKNVKNFIIKNDMIVYSTDKSIKLIDNKRRIHVIDNIASVYLDASEDKNTFYIGYVKEVPNVSANFNYAAYNYASNSINVYRGTKVLIMHNNSLVNSVINVTNGYVNNLVVFREWESGNAWAININFEVGKQANPAIDDINLDGYNPNPMIIKGGKGYMEFVATTDNQRTYKTTYESLGVFTVKNKDIVDLRFLTKTPGISKEPKMFTLGKDTYLQWEDASSDSKTINFASTNNMVIKKAKMLSSDEIGNILINTIFGIGFGISFMLLFIAVILFPGILLIVIIGMVALNWLERNTKKMLNICIGLQLLVNIYVTMRFGSMLDKVRMALPGFMQQTSGLFIIIALTTVAAAYCVKRKYGKLVPERSIIEQYAFFALINIVLYSLIYYPYYQL